MPNEVQVGGSSAQINLLWLSQECREFVNYTQYLPECCLTIGTECIGKNKSQEKKFTISWVFNNIPNLTENSHRVYAKFM